MVADEDTAAIAVEGQQDTEAMKQSLKVEMLARAKSSNSMARPHDRLEGGRILPRPRFFKMTCGKILTSQFQRGRRWR